MSKDAHSNNGTTPILKGSVQGGPVGIRLGSALTGAVLNSLPEILVSSLKFTDAISCHSPETKHYHSEVKGLGGRLVIVDKMKINRYRGRSQGDRDEAGDNSVGDSSALGMDLKCQSKNSEIQKNTTLIQYLVNQLVTNSLWPKACYRVLQTSYPK